MNNKYTIVLYIRLSVEDGDVGQGGKNESNSVASQRAMLRDYVRLHEELSGATVIELCEACDIIEPNRRSLATSGFRVIWSKLYYKQGLIPRPLISRT